MPQLSDILSDLGLDTIESKIYFLCLKYERIWVSTISRMLNIPRSTIHDHVDKLHQKAFLISHKEKKWYSYSASRAEDLIGILHHKEKNIQKNLQIIKENQELFDIHIINFTHLPKINYYEWLDAINLIYNKYRASKQNYSFFDLDIAMKYTWYDINYFIDIGKKHTGLTKEILIKSKNAEQYARHITSSNYEIKFIQWKKNNFFSDNMMFDGIYYHISFGESILAIEINNPIYYETQKLLFEELRKRL